MMRSLRILLIISTFLISTESVYDDDSRLIQLDGIVQNLNLTSIHFEDPGQIVRVDVIANSFQPVREDLIAAMMKKLNDTANQMVNSNATDRMKWENASMDLPTPHPTQLVKALAP